MKPLKMDFTLLEKIKHYYEKFLGDGDTYMPIYPQTMVVAPEYLSKLEGIMYGNHESKLNWKKTIPEVPKYGTWKIPSELQEQWAAAADKVAAEVAASTAVMNEYGAELEAWFDEV